MWWYWNINQLSIAYASRPRLRSRLTLGGLTFPRNPWTYGAGVSRSRFATHAGIRTCNHSTVPYGPASQLLQRSPTDHRPKGRQSRSFGTSLSPATLSARNHSTSELLRTLSRVAASKPTSWLSVQLHILSHLAKIRDLSWRSGLFPSRLRSLSPAVSLPGSEVSAFGVWLRSVSLLAP